jgi:hypothetical protein
MPQGTVRSLNKGEKVSYKAGQAKSAMTTEGEHRAGSGGRRITFGMSWARLLGKAGAGGPPARRPPPRKWCSLAPGGSRTMCGTSWPCRKSVASQK